MQGTQSLLIENVVKIMERSPSWVAQLAGVLSCTLERLWVLSSVRAHLGGNQSKALSLSLSLSLSPSLFLSFSVSPPPSLPVSLKSIKNIYPRVRIKKHNNRGEKTKGIIWIGKNKDICRRSSIGRKVGPWVCGRPGMGPGFCGLSQYPLSQPSPDPDSSPQAPKPFTSTYNICCSQARVSGMKKVQDFLSCATGCHGGCLLHEIFPKATQTALGVAQG